MKNKIMGGLLICIGLLLTSCFKDTGNYDYADSEVITIGNVQKDTTIAQFAKLTIRPEVISNLAEAEFEYVYWVYDKNKGTQTPDTLLVGQKDLVDYTVSLEANEYNLIFQATNVKTGVKGFWETKLNVTTNSNHGWYILKSLGNTCDMDYYSMTGEKAENVLLMSSGRQLDGDRAERLTIGSNYEDSEDFDSKTNTFKKKTVLFPVSNRDAKAVELSTGKIISDFPQMFLEEPVGPYAPGMAFASGMAQFILNHGKVYNYGLHPSQPAVSKFSTEFARNEAFDDYRLSKYVIYAQPNFIVFDELTTSFVSVPGFGTYLWSLTDLPDTEVKANNNKMNLLWAGSKGLYSSVFRAVMQDQNDLSRKFIAHITCYGTNMSIKCDNLQADDPAYGASLFTINHSNAQLLYFVNGRTVYSRSSAAIPGANAPLDLTLPEGEIVFIKHVCPDVYAYPKPQESIDYLFIGTQKEDGTYELNGYKLNAGGTPEGKEPALRFSGEGRVGDVMFVFPSVQSTTFVPSY